MNCASILVSKDDRKKKLNMEKRFSVIKFIQSMGADFAIEKNRAITRNICPWWIRCDGMTEEEMKNLSYCTCEEWME